MLPNIAFYMPGVELYATLLQLGLEPMTQSDKETQVKPATSEKSTQTEKPGILWGYF